MHLIILFLANLLILKQHAILHLVAKQQLIKFLGPNDAMHRHTGSRSDRTDGIHLLGGLGLTFVAFHTRRLVNDGDLAEVAGRPGLDEGDLGGEAGGAAYVHACKW